MELNFAKSQTQIIDIFTKPLKLEDFRRLRMLFRVTNKFKRAC